MLKQNTTIFAQYPLRRLGGAFCQERSLFGRTDKRNWFASENTSRDQKSGFPDGTLAPGTALLAQKDGGIASRNNIAGLGVITSSGTLGLNAAGSLSGTGDLTAIGQLIVSALASLSGSGAISNADAKAYLNALASLSGNGAITASVAALGWLTSGLTGTGDTTGTARATGALDATIRGYSDLTPEGIRDKVWQAVIEAGYSAEQILRLLSAHAAGSATGLEGANPQFKGLDGVTTRIDGSYSGGTRTINTLNGE